MAGPATGVLLLAGASVGTSVYLQKKSESAAKEAQKKAQAAAAAEAAKQRQWVEQRELEAGEYFEELTKEQMILQSQEHQLELLTSIINTEQTPEPQIITLPAAKTQTPLTRINLAIEEFLRGL